MALILIKTSNSWKAGGWFKQLSENNTKIGE